jgi:choline dehydrogenase
VDAFDVVVVGGGSAGCAAAARLVERTDLHVCLLEAGPDYGAFGDARWPAELLDAARMPRTHDWGYSETRDGELRPESRAKVIGGCSTHNQCAAVWGQPEDYDAWGIPGWMFADLESSMREVDRLVAATPSRQLSSWQSAWLEAAVNDGLPRIADVGERGSHIGVAAFHANIRDGVRWNAAFAFLDRVRSKPTLTVRDNVEVEVVEERREGVTLTYTGAGGRFDLAARRCLLCAGAYGSPSILLRSGLGGDDVGANLHDHCGVRVRFAPSDEAKRRLEADFDSGRFRQSQLIARTKTKDAAAFDLHIAPYQTQTDEGEWTFQVLAFHLSPRSRGRFSLVDGLATIDFGFLTDPADEAALKEALRIARKLAGVEPLASLIDGELEPADAGVRATLTGYAHAVGTCALGKVVDPDCRVRGASRVYVADASIIPTIPRANPNLTCFLIGLRAADLLAVGG